MELISTEEARCKRFKQSPHTEIRAILAIRSDNDFSILVTIALNIEKAQIEEQNCKQ